MKGRAGRQACLAAPRTPRGGAALAQTSSRPPANKPARQPRPPCPSVAPDTMRPLTSATWTAAEMMEPQARHCASSM